MRGLILTAARLQKAPFTMPEEFPVLSIAAARAYYWLEGRDPAQAKQLAQALYFKIFGEGVNVSAPEAVIAVAETLGIDGEELAAALQDPAVKERLKAETQSAIDRGVFGSPFVIVDGASFWGADRLDQVEAWLETGGW
jgi:2-hydroxychromene-2-carboxylate isomerase